MTKELRLPRKPASCIRLLLCVVFAFFSLSINAQTVTGTVTSTQGEKLSGVTVTPKGSNNGTTTDADGNYGFVLPDDTYTMTCKATGFVLQTFTITIAGGVAVTQNVAMVAE